MQVFLFEIESCDYLVFDAIRTFSELLFKPCTRPLDLATDAMYTLEAATTVLERACSLDKVRNTVAHCLLEELTCFYKSLETLGKIELC